ncbi:MAG: hypothetical protein ACP5ME_13770, partial [Anaerolineae bacterium]
AEGGEGVPVAVDGSVGVKAGETTGGAGDFIAGDGDGDRKAIVAEGISGACWGDTGVIHTGSWQASSERKRKARGKKENRRRLSALRCTGVMGRNIAGSLNPDR